MSPFIAVGQSWFQLKAYVKKPNLLVLVNPDGSWCRSGNPQIFRFVFKLWVLLDYDDRKTHVCVLPSAKLAG